MSFRWISFRVAAILLVGIALAAYAPSYRADFIWDDNYLVWDNPLNHNLGGLWKYWFSTEAADYWPLTSTLIWLDWQVWGNNPAPYHVQTILFHAINAVWLWLLLRHLRVKGAWLAALLWAVHPVNAATVGWISELKNTFSMLLVLPAMLAYLKFDESGRRWLYLASLLLFLLAMLAKTSIVGIPLVLLLCIWWRRGRLGWKDLIRMVPFLGIAAVLGGVTVWYHMFNPARDTSLIVPAGGCAARVAAAGWAVWFYISKTLVPLNLIMVYPRWQINSLNPLVYLPAVATIGALVAFWRLRNKWGRHALLAAGSFLVLILPALGFVNMSYMQHTLVADHFQYLPMAATLAGMVAAVSTWVDRSGPRVSSLALLASGLLVVVLAVASARRAWIMRGHESLWRDTIARNPNAWIAYFQLGTELLLQGDGAWKSGKTDEARAAYEEAVQWLQTGARRRPEHPETFHNLGTALNRLGRTEPAIAAYRQALAIREDSVATHHDLALALHHLGKHDEAKRHFLRALELSNGTHQPTWEALRQFFPHEPLLRNPSVGPASSNRSPPEISRATPESNGSTPDALSVSNNADRGRAQFAD